MSNTIIGNCPVCQKGQIVQNEKGYRCNHFKSLEDKCSFTIYQTMFGKEITPEIVLKIISEKETPTYNDWKNKEGKAFTAKLILQGEYLKPDFSTQFIDDLECCCCNGKIIITKNGYACENFMKNECGIFVFKTIADYELDIEDVKVLISGGKTETIDDFVSKKGESFSAKLYIDDNDFKVKFDSEVCDCPKCKVGVINNFSKSYSCSNWNNDDNKCDFSIWKVQYGAVFSEDDIIDLIENKETGKKTFVSKDKTKYKGKLVMDADFKVSINKI